MRKNITSGNKALKNHNSEGFMICGLVISREGLVTSFGGVAFAPAGFIVNCPPISSRRVRGCTKVKCHPYRAANKLAGKVAGMVVFVEYTLRLHLKFARAGVTGLHGPPQKCSALMRLLDTRCPCESCYS